MNENCKLTASGGLLISLHHVDNPSHLASEQQGTAKLTAGYSTSPLSPYHTKTATVSKIQETIKQSAS